MWIVLVFLRKNTRIHKNGRNSWTFRFCPFFGLVCRGDSWNKFVLSDSSPWAAKLRQKALYMVVASMACKRSMSAGNVSSFWMKMTSPTKTCSEDDDKNGTQRESNMHQSSTRMSGRRTSGSSRPSLGVRFLPSFPSFPRKICSQKMSGRTPGGSRHSSSRHPWPSEHQLSGTGDSQRDSRESIRANLSQLKPLFL